MVRAEGRRQISREERGRRSVAGGEDTARARPPSGKQTPEQMWSEGRLPGLGSLPGCSAGCRGQAGRQASEDEAQTRGIQRWTLPPSTRAGNSPEHQTWASAWRGSEFARLAPPAGAELLRALCRRQGGRGQVCTRSLLRPDVAFLQGHCSGVSRAGLAVSLLTDGGPGVLFIQLPTLCVWSYKMP